MKKRHYINKKPCMLVMYGIIIFFFFFCLEMDFWRLLWHGIHPFVLLPHHFFGLKAKKCNLWSSSSSSSSPLKFASALKLLWVTQNFRLPFKCTEAFPLKKPARMDFDNLMWQKKNIYIKKNKQTHKKNFGKMFKIHIPLGGDIETMLLPKTV